MFQLSERIYRIFGTPIYVASECPPLSHHSHTFLSNLECPEDQPVLRVSLFQTGGADERKGVHLCCPEMRWAESADSPSKAWFPFRRLLLRLILDAERPDVMFHGSTVCDNFRNAATVIGISGAGKTTTTIGLLKSGLTLVADEYTSITMEDNMVRSFPSGVSVTPETVRLFPELQSLLHKHCRFMDAKGPLSTVNLSQLYSASDPESLAMPRCMFFLSPAFGERSRIEPCTYGEAIWHLQAGLYPRRPRPLWARKDVTEYHRRTFSFVDRLARTARVFRVTNGNIHDTVALMADALRSVQPQLEMPAGVAPVG